MQLTDEQWTIQHLREHLQYAVDLELWTIPFYMSAMYSVVDRSSEAFQLIQSIVNQEMLHLQLASNVANAYGLQPAFAAPIYEGQHIPHLNFNLDTPDPRDIYSPYSAEIGSLDTLRINAMCLIEYPEWDTGHKPNLNDDVSQYGSIGELYDAIEYGMTLLRADLHGGVNQVDHFSAFYRNMPAMTITQSGAEGLFQAKLLIEAIRDQGEGTSRTDEQIAEPFQNTADDGEPELSHYDKFLKIHDSVAKPLTYAVKPVGEYTAEDKRILEILLLHFTQLRGALTGLFSGQNPDNFVQLMITVGADIQNCWKHGVTPRFS